MNLVESTRSEEKQAFQKPIAGAEGLVHRQLRRDDFWRKIPAFSNVDAKTFHSHLFQMQNSVPSVGKLMSVLGDLVSSEFYQDVSSGLQRAPMSIRISPYLLGLIDWDHPYEDPLRTQFLPVGSQ